MLCITNILFRGGIILLPLAFFMSCNNPAPTIQAQTPSAKTAAPAAEFAVDGLLDVLYMERQEFFDLPTNPVRPNPQTPPNLKKLTFQFCVPDTGRNSFTLAVFSSRNQRFDPGTEWLHNSWIDSETDVTDRLVYFGNLKMGKPSIRRLRTELEQNPTHTFIIFYPIIVNNRLTYNIHTAPNLEEGGIKNLAKQPSLFSLNPSPPASENDEED